MLKSLWLLLYPLAFALSNIFSRFPTFVENFFSTGIYPYISRAVGAVFSVFPFSFAEFLLYSLVLAVVVFFIVCIVRALRRKLTLVRFVSWLLTVLIIGGAGFNAFYWMWGFNYYRVPLATRMGLNMQPGAEDELETICIMLAETANDLRTQVQEDEFGLFVYEDGNTGVLAKIPAAYENLGDALSMFSGTVYRPKPVWASEALSYAGIAGIFIPFTEEANVNVADPPLCVASSGAHETAHFLGIASEDAANFVAYLACICSDDAEVRYSGVMHALILCGNALSTEDPEAYANLHAMYDPAIRRDLDAYNAYLKAHEGEVSEKASEMNDNYLRAHQQTTGIRSYGEMVDLVLGFYRTLGIFG